MPSYPTLAGELLSSSLGEGSAFASPMLPDWIRRRVKELMLAREAEAARVLSSEQWGERRKYLREKLFCSLGLNPLPERTPLDARNLGSVERNGYLTQKVLFEARPGCVAAGHLYLPENIRKPAPAVLFAVGHWIENAKMEPDMQAACIGLAKLGFVVLIYDPLDQGERRVDWRCHSHLEGLLVGTSQTGLAVWESMRAIDYLQSRPEVDAARIGMTGASGGGHNTMYVSALDERVKVSIPVCYVNAFEYLLEAMRGYNWVGGQDLCNQVPRILSYADMGDICALVASRPLMIINATQDPMFPTDGARQAAARAQRIYNLLGVSDRIRLTLVDAGHGYDQQMRQAAYGWFTKWLKGEGDGSPIPEPPLTVARPRYSVHYITATADPEQPRPVADPLASPELYCFPPDQPTSSSAAVTEAVRKRARALPPLKEAPSTLADWLVHTKSLSKSLREVIGPLPEKVPFAPGIVNRISHERIFVECIVYESEPGIRVPAMLYLNEDWEGYQPVAIYVTDRGKRAGLLDGSIEKLLNLGFAVFTLDLRGTGESAATEFENASDSYMLDRDLFAQRLWDLRRAIDYLAEYLVIGVQIDKHRIACIGQGVAGLLAVYAGALDRRVAAVGCIEAPVSYKDMIAENAAYPASAYLFNVLNHFEMSQVASMIGPRLLCIANPLDGQAQRATKDAAEKAYAWCRQVYRVLGTETRFRVKTQLPHPAVAAIGRWFLEEWEHTVDETKGYFSRERAG